MKVAPIQGGVGLHWPTGDVSALIPLSTDHYLDRAYWMPVEVVRDENGRASSLKYGNFTGEAVKGGKSSAK